MSITLTQLRSFLAVVRGGSVTAAADELVVTQPSVSAAVSALAREVGVKLLEREGRGVRPTAAGREFADHAADVIGLLEKGARAARDVQARRRLALRIAAVHTAAESFVPPLMQAFAGSHPDIGLGLEVGNRDQILGMVLGHEADVAIGGRPPRNVRIEAHPVLPNEFVLISAREDRLAGDVPASASELAACRWLLRERGSGTRQVNEEYLAATEIAVETLTLGSNGAIKQAARAGLGVSFVSRDAVITELQAGVLGVIPVEVAPPAREWYAMRSSIGPSRPAVSDFLAFVTSPAARRALLT